MDHKNSQFAVCGTGGSSETINHYYLIKTDDLTIANKDTDNIITWPTEFQPLTAYEAAEIYMQGLDPDDISIRQGEYQKAEHQRLLDALVAWDADLKLAAQDNRGGFDLDEPEIDIGLL